MSNPTAKERQITVLAVDDHPLLREGIASVLADQPDILLVGEAADGPSGIEQFRRHRPDVTLMDLQMPGMSGIEAMRIIRREFPEACVIVLTTFRRDVEINNALRDGAAGFVLKDNLRKDLRDMIRAAHSGQPIVPPDVAQELAHHVADGTLSLREIEVLRSVARGHSNKIIAVELAITEDTVKAHMRNILAKLGANDRTHAVVMAAKRGFIEL